MTGNLFMFQVAGPQSAVGNMSTVFNAILQTGD